MSKVQKSVDELKNEFQLNRNQISEIQKFQNQILTNSYENNIKRVNYNTIPTKIDSIWNARFNPRTKNHND